MIHSIGKFLSEHLLCARHCARVAETNGPCQRVGCRHQPNSHSSTMGCRRPTLRRGAEHGRGGHPGGCGGFPGEGTVSWPQRTGGDSLASQELGKGAHQRKCSRAEQVLPLCWQIYQSHLSPSQQEYWAAWALRAWATTRRFPAGAWSSELQRREGWDEVWAELFPRRPPRWLADRCLPLCHHPVLPCVRLCPSLLFLGGHQSYCIRAFLRSSFNPNHHFKGLISTHSHLWTH